MKKKYILIILSLLLLTVLITGCGQKVENELVIGMELAYPPFETTDAEGTPSGISVDMAYALGEYLDRPIRIENMSYSGLIPALTTGKIDIILSSMTITEKRLEVVDFSDPYAIAQLTLLVNQDSPVNAFEDLKEEGRILAVRNGTVGHVYATENLPAENIAVFERESECVQEVAAGRADAFVYDALTVYRNSVEHPTTRPVFAPFQESPDFWGMALQKDQPELLNAINAFIAEYQSSGEMNLLADKYLSEIKEIFEEKGLPFFFDIK